MWPRELPDRRWLSSGREKVQNEDDIVVTWCCGGRGEWLMSETHTVVREMLDPFLPALQ